MLNSKTTIIFLILLFSAFLSNFAYFIFALAHLITYKPNSLVRYENRFKNLKPDIKILKIGYLTDNDSKNWTNNGKDLAEFLVIRYVLIPHMISPYTNQNMVVGNFHNTNDYTSYLSRYNLKIVKNYGNGVLLLTKIK